MPPKIIQIATAAPVGGEMALLATKPILFALNEDGEVFIREWFTKKWIPIDKADD